MPHPKAEPSRRTRTEVLAPPRLAGPDPWDSLFERLAHRDPAAYWYEPIPWNPQVPARSGPTEFPTRIADIVDACPGQHVYLASDCSEAPCYAFLGSRAGVGPWDESGACPDWLETYGSPARTMLRLKVPCAQGSITVEALSPSTAVTDSLPPELADDYQLAMDRKVPRLRAVLTPERLAELCAQFYASEGGSP